MDDATLYHCLWSALVSAHEEIEEIQQGKNSPKAGCELAFQRHFKSHARDAGYAEAERSGEKFLLSEWGGSRVVGERDDGDMDLVTRGKGKNGVGEYAFEFKVVGFPSALSKSRGYNIWQIGQDSLRLQLLRHKSGSRRSVRGGWIIVLGIGEQIEATPHYKADENALRIMHNALHCEFSEAMEMSNDGVGFFDNARSIGGCYYLGLHKAYYDGIRPPELYFAVKPKETPRYAALAAFVGH